PGAALANWRPSRRFGALTSPRPHRHPITTATLPTPPDDRLVLGELAVAGKRREIRDQRADIVEAVRSLRMARHLGLLPRGEFVVEVLERVKRLCLEPHDLLTDGDAVPARLDRTQFLDLGFEFRHRLFKIEVAAHRSEDRRFKEWIGGGRGQSRL